MIVRHVDGVCYVIRQSEHARQSAVIAAHLRLEFMGDMVSQRAILEATAIHDAGWDVWDDAPLLDEGGLPLNFDDIPKADHRDIWRRTIFELLPTYGPLVGMILARHAMALGDGEDSEAETDYPSIIASLQDRAWPGMAQEERTFLLERAFHALSLSDALSLKACAGWPGEQHFDLIDNDGHQHSIAVTPSESDPWTFHVAPWPFAVDAVRNVFVDAVALPAAEQAEAAAVLSEPRHYLVRRPVTYLPA